MNMRDQRQDTHDQPVKAEERDQHEYGRAGIGQQQNSENDSGNALEQEEPPDARMMRRSRCHRHGSASLSALIAPIPRNGARPLQLTSERPDNGIVGFHIQMTLHPDKQGNEQGILRNSSFI
jgi:hypothetical protein